jgi:hypothetical protein
MTKREFSQKPHQQKEVIIMKDVVRFLVIILLLATTAVTFTGCDNGSTKNWEDPEYDKDGFDKDGFDKDGFDRDGFDREGFDSEGFDREGFDINGLDREGNCKLGLEGGFNKDGIFVATGKPYNNEGYKQDGTYWRDDQGYDFQGWNVAGWNKNGINKETNKPHDVHGNKEDGTYWRDKDGFDWQGVDTKGFVRLPEPVSKGALTGTELISGGATESLQQGRASGTGSRHLLILSRLTEETRNYFTAHGNTGTNNPGLNDVVITQMNAILNPVHAPTSGDLVILDTIIPISRYLAPMIAGLPAGEQDNFRLVMDTFRAREYVNARQIKNSQTYADSLTELAALFSQLVATNGVGANSNNFPKYMDDTVIPMLSMELNMNPGLIRTLLNHITTFERFYASRDDIQALDLVPVMTGVHIGTYVSHTPARTVDFVRGHLATAENELAQR